MKVYMQDNLRIGIVCYPTYGGSGVIATELGIALANLGHQVHFISYDKPFRLDLLSAKIFYHEVTIPDYPLFEYTPYELNLTSKLVDVAINEKLDLLKYSKDYYRKRGTGRPTKKDRRDIDDYYESPEQ